MIIIQIQRSAHVQPVVQVIHRIHVDTHHPIGVGQDIRAEIRFRSSALPAAKHNDIGTPMLLETGQRSVGRLLFGPVEIIGQRHLCRGNIQTGIRHRRVAIAEMRGAESDIQIELSGEHPAQIDAEVHIGRHLRTDHVVRHPVGLIIGMPAIGHAEIPLVVEGELRRQRLDGGTLEEIGGNGVADLIVQMVIAQTCALISALIDTGLFGIGRGHERIFQTRGEILVHRAHLGIIALQISVGMQHGAIDDLCLQTVDDRC